MVNLAEDDNRIEGNESQDSKLLMLGTKDTRLAQNRLHAPSLSATTRERVRGVSAHNSREAGLAETLESKEFRNETGASISSGQGRLHIGLGTDRKLTGDEIGLLTHERDRLRRSGADEVVVNDVNDKQFDQLRAAGFRANGGEIVRKGTRTVEDLTRTDSHATDEDETQTNVRAYESQN